MTPEAKILDHAKRRAKEYGLAVVRMSLAPGVEVGWPDLLIVGTGGRVLFMETKARGRKLRPIQEERRRLLVEVYGHAYAAPDSTGAVDKEIKDFADGV